MLDNNATPHLSPPQAQVGLTALQNLQDCPDVAQVMQRFLDVNGAGWA